MHLMLSRALIRMEMVNRVWTGKSTTRNPNISGDSNTSETVWKGRGRYIKNERETEID